MQVPQLQVLAQESEILMTVEVFGKVPQLRVLALQSGMLMKEGESGQVPQLRVLALQSGMLIIMAMFIRARRLQELVPK